MVELVLQYNGHHEQAVFAVTCIGKEDLILRLPWLKKHNLEVDWTTESVVLELRCSLPPLPLLRMRLYLVPTSLILHMSVSVAQVVAVIAHGEILARGTRGHVVVHGQG